MAREGTLTIEDARIVFRNFEGKEGKYNREGDRNFCVILDPGLADQLDKDGWNIKTLKAREEGDDDVPYLQVSVSYKGRYPAKVYLITSRGKTLLPEELVSSVDHVFIGNADIMINPYKWEVNGKGGIKAYLSTAFITVEEDELEKKYADVPDASEWLPPEEEY